MKVIGINGHKGAGKGEVGRLLKEELPGENVLLLGFADKLKILAAKALGFDRSDEECIDLMNSVKDAAYLSILYDEPDLPSTHIADNSMLHGITGRQYLQFFGDNTRNVLGYDVWVDAVLPGASGPLTHQSALRAMYPNVDYLVFTDLRYRNEAERVLAMDGVNWEILRPGCEPDGHISENKLPRQLIAHQIDNSGNLEHLRDQVRAAKEATL